MNDPKEKAADDGKFGTFGGAFTSSAPTILGVISSLRFGQVVGQARALPSQPIIIVTDNVATAIHQ